MAGFVLWTGVLSDRSGRLTPDIGSLSYVAAVVGVTVLFAYADRNRSSFGKNRRLARKRRS